MDLTQLRYFQAVARCGNITRAARELYVTQPNMSKSIARLEEELKVPLFDHRKGKIELNDYGRMFLSSVDIAFSQLNSGVQTIQRMYESNQHILSLGCNISGYLPDMLPPFCAEHPEIGIRQLDCSTQQIIEHLLDRSITLGISSVPIEHDQLEFHELGHKEYVIAAHQEHPLASGDRVSLRQLEHETFICDNSRLRVEPLRKLCARYGFTPTVGYEIQSTELVYQLVEANCGIAILPIGLCCQVMHRHPESHLKLLRIEDDVPPVIIGIAHHRSFQYTKAASLFEQYIKDCLRREEELILEMGYAFKE